MIDLDKVNNVWARIYKYQDCKNDNQTINYVRAIQYGKAVIRDVTPSELLSMDIEDVKKITKIDELYKMIADAQEKAFGPIVEKSLKKYKKINEPRRRAARYHQPP